jgi:hypothetical protein
VVLLVNQDGHGSVHPLVVDAGRPLLVQPAINGEFEEVLGAVVAVRRSVQDRGDDPDAVLGQPVVPGGRHGEPDEKGQAGAHQDESRHPPGDLGEPQDPAFGDIGRPVVQLAPDPAVRFPPAHHGIPVLSALMIEP